VLAAVYYQETYGMALNDVWRTIGENVGFYYESTFEDVPTKPGIYAWFYPLRLVSRTEDALQKLVTQVQLLQSYDSKTREPEVVGLESSAPAWWQWSITASRRGKPLQLSEINESIWKRIASDETAFTEFQRALLKSSILMPPLYVGKANDLCLRCETHRKASGDRNCFNRRFTEFAKKEKFDIDSVSKLIFVCVSTELIADEQETEAHPLLEELLKAMCAPPYGWR
jgi:hypothetical protein